MQFTKGKKFDNKVVGNKSGDNKDPKNKNKTTYSATQQGKVGPSVGDTKLRTQNSKEYSPGQDSQQGNATIKEAAKYSKKPTKGRQTLYSDGAMAFAKRVRGMQ